MRRAIFIAGFDCPVAVGRAREFIVTPARLPAARVPALKWWQAFAAGLDVELSASWLILRAPKNQPRVPAGVPTEVSAAFRACLAVGTERELARAVRTVERAAAGSRVVTDFDTVALRCSAFREAGKRIVFTNGVFDLFHLGHLRLLQRARALGDALVVGINSDDSARSLKGRSRPVVPQFARAEIVAGVRGVDLCAIFSEADPRELLRAVRPHILAKGSEYTLGRVVGRRMVEAWGGRVVLIPHVSGWSSTGMIRALRGERE